MKTIPTIFMRWVDVKEVHTAYHEGEFKSVQLPGTDSNSKISVKVKEIVRELYEGGQDNNRFNIRTRDGTELVIVTTNTVLFNRMFKHKDSDIPIRCGHCRADIPKNNIPVLIANRLETVPVLHPGSDQPVHTIFYLGKKPHCDFNCAFATILNKRNGIPSDAEYNLKTIFEKMYPSETLRAAEDPDMLDINGGDVSYEHYKSQRNQIYLPTVGVIMYPIKSALVRM